MPYNYPSARAAEYRKPRSFTWTTSWSVARGRDRRKQLARFNSSDGGGSGNEPYPPTLRRYTRASHSPRAAMHVFNRRKAMSDRDSNRWRVLTLAVVFAGVLACHVAGRALNVSVRARV